MAANTKTETTGGEVIEPSAEECFELIASQPVGRLAVARSDGPPLVIPVNFRLDSGVIVFRSDPGLKLRLLLRGPVSFQVDYIDWPHRTGWSVLVHGDAYQATHWERDHIELVPWAGGDKGTWVRIEAATVTGRRLLPADLDWPADNRGYL